jgi:hypothetical protein
MINSSVSEFIEELKVNIDRIWDKPPDEIRKMKQNLNIPRMRAFFKVNYAFHDLKSIAESLSVLGTCANEGMSMDCIKAATTRFINVKCILMTASGLTDTVQLLKKASEIIEEVQNAKEYLDVVDLLNIYVRKMSDTGWLDLEMHWSEISSAYDMIDSVKS